MRSEAVEFTVTFLGPFAVATGTASGGLDFQIILDLFSPHAKKRPYIHPIYRIYTAESPKSAAAGQMQEKCLCIVILMMCQCDPGSSPFFRCLLKYFPSCSPSRLFF